VGGWGLVLGDEASGAWLGRALLSRALHVRDGLAEPSGLIGKVMEQFGGDPAKVVQFAAQSNPADFATLAPLVAEAFAADDPVAVALLKAGTDYLERGLTALGWRADARLCLLGGLAPLYTRALFPQLSGSLAAPLGSALDGALAMAKQAAMAQAGQA
jgi:glucosamine kinase